MVQANLRNIFVRLGALFFQGRGGGEETNRQAIWCPVVINSTAASEQKVDTILFFSNDDERVLEYPNHVALAH